MKKLIVYILLGIVVSFFLFPFSFSFFPALNTKMMLAALGVFLFGLYTVRLNDARVHKDILIAGLLAFVFSVCCHFSATEFLTGDDSYSKYFMSFFVWIFGAYSVCHFLRLEYGTVSLRTLTNYLAVVCVVQCFLAQIISSYPGVQGFVDRYIVQGQEHLHSVDRIYGIGASLDNAGVRFSFTEILLAFFIVEDSKDSSRRKTLWLKYIFFAIILLYGNMIARTTTVGAVLGLCYIAADMIRNFSFTVKESKLRSFGMLLFIVFAAVLLFSYLYSSNANMHTQLRFAFEGFFNWVETGHFSTDSTDKLNRQMWVWPQDTKTWLIGTGLFGNWAFGTDIGYCRFIMYCGLLGFSVFCLFFIHNASAFRQRYKGTGLLSLFLLALTFVIWLKVSTDIFQIYALLFCADNVVNTPQKLDS